VAGVQDRHPVDDPAEDPDFGRQDSERDDDFLPARGGAVILPGKPTMDRKSRYIVLKEEAAPFFGFYTGVPYPGFHADRYVARSLDGGTDDLARQHRIFDEFCARAGLEDLSHRAAHVNIDAVESHVTDISCRAFKMFGLEPPDLSHQRPFYIRVFEPVNHRVTSGGAHAVYIHELGKKNVGPGVSGYHLPEHRVGYVFHRRQHRKGSLQCFPETGHIYLWKNEYNLLRTVQEGCGAVPAKPAY